MSKLKQSLDKLLKEKKARAEIMFPAMGTIDQAPIEKEELSPKEKWNQERKAWLKRYSKNPELQAAAGEIANMVDGLTPKGYDKKGKKISFVETGKPLTGLHR